MRIRCRGYLSIAERRDVIELPIIDDLDINGWELRKALRLMKKGNPVLFEWLHSPLRYRTDEAFMAALMPVADRHYSPSAAFHHYLHMAYNNWREYLRGPTVRLKKYLYVLRPVLACRWIEAGRGTPPMEFDQLVDALVTDHRLRSAIDGLIERKRHGDELNEGPAIPEINVFLNEEIVRLDAVAATLPRKVSSDDDVLDKLFQRVVLASG